MATAHEPAHWGTTESDTVEHVDYDFDAAWAARRRRRPRVRILGRMYALPASPPAKLILFAASAQRRNPDQTIDPDTVVELLGSVIGSENVTALLNEGLDLDQLADVLRYCMDRMKNWANQGEAAAPNEGAATANTPSA
ncbi:hypothetical protein GCM10012275_54470 [Longimycelium tulufanense]|uniref:Uncharacterized protein n=1 Tax=Longimycelium tulufanense TaxID=907463 RepID=A0A8J3CDD3_9PSEU|nr:hypothetical protein [Longimycelium tulufanense]GGM76890.1 hypothetical protein GCM10012275_54470 [Longimycelium tulufanense]